MKSNGHIVFSAYDECRGCDDKSLLEKAHKENFILITNDKDFGALIYQQKLPQRGLILLRLDNDTPANKIVVLKRVIELHGEKIADHFTVASEKTIRLT